MSSQRLSTPSRAYPLASQQINGPIRRAPNFIAQVRSSSSPSPSFRRLIGYQTQDPSTRKTFGNRSAVRSARSGRTVSNHAIYATVDSSTLLSAGGSKPASGGRVPRSSGAQIFAPSTLRSRMQGTGSENMLGNCWSVLTRPVVAGLALHR